MLTPFLVIHVFVWLLKGIVTICKLANDEEDSAGVRVIYSVSLVISVLMCVWTIAILRGLSVEA